MLYNRVKTINNNIANINKKVINNIIYSIILEINILTNKYKNYYKFSV